jgi:N utilization substance protein B
MANRHLARSVVLQTLFEWDSTRVSAEASKDILKRNIEEFAQDVNDTPFMQELLDGVLSKHNDLDLIIEKAAPEWPLDKIAVIDRNILRIGLYELLFADRTHVPAKVAINEAIELAKTFGGESSGRFVNGVLGAVYKEIGEPGKEDLGKRKKPAALEELPIEKLGGAVVYAEDGGQIYLALVHDIFGHWTLSKGHIENDATTEKGIARVVQEELGLSGAVEDKLGENEYVASHPEKGKLRKQVVYHLVRSPFEPLVLKETGGLDDAQWFKLQDILDLNFYHDMLPVVTNAVQRLVNRP